MTTSIISLSTHMTDNEASVPESLPGEWIRLMKTTGVTDARMDGFLPLGQLEGNRVRQISSAFNCRFFGAEFSLDASRVYETSRSIITAGSAHTAVS